jgi:hypothetical protein
LSLEPRKGYLETKNYEGHNIQDVLEADEPSHDISIICFQMLVTLMLNMLTNKKRWNT